MSLSRIRNRLGVRLLVGLTAGLIALTVTATIVWLGPLPPRVVLMSTGPPGSDYALDAEHYRQVLKRSGVELRLLASAGGMDNLRRLNDPKSGVMVGFAQGGLIKQQDAPELRSLGSIFYEPLWLFSRVPLRPRIQDLRGKRISLGMEGSGTRVLALQLLRLNGMTEEQLELQSMAPAQASQALLAGDIDAAGFVVSWESPHIRRLLASSEVDVIAFPRADAYIALFPYLSKVRLPRGVGNMATNRPPTDVDLIAAEASLIVRHDLNPAVQYLLLEAGTEIHSAAGMFQRQDQFPRSDRADVPLSREAREFYRSRNPPFLQRYLHFWVAVLVHRVLILLIPALAVAYPFLQSLPALYLWIVRRRILHLYSELKQIETDLAQSSGPAVLDAGAALGRLEQRAHRLRVPAALTPELYTLRGHITMVHGRSMAPRIGG